jgi:peptide/nickel transport system substrate-binding protein
VLDANARFWHGAPKLKHVVLRHVPEAASQRLLLEKGDVDVARNLTPDQIPALANNKQLSLLTTPGTELLYLGLNQNVPVLANPQVREALRWLVDYQGLSRTVLKGQYNVHQSFLGKGTANALTDTPYHLDVAKAKALLAKAHLSNGFDLTLDVMNSSPFTDIAQSIQSTFAQAGVRVKLLPADAKQVWTKFRGRATQAALVYWVPDYLDPQSSADFFTNNPDNSANGKVKNAAWRVAWNIPGLTKETRAALLEPNAAKRGADYLNLQRKVQKDSPFVFLFQKTDQTVIRSNLHHFIVGPSWDTPVYWGASK